MDLHAEPHTFKTLLGIKKVFSIPRYQREFSWGKRELTEMYNDIVERLTVDQSTNKLCTTEYFFGNIILQGDLANNSVKEMQVIDGQQRLTSVTIFLAALAKRFEEKKEFNLCAGAKQYIIGKDDDNKDFPILVNKTPAPFFQFKIQGMNEADTPKSEEEDAILYAYQYFYNQLGKNKLTKYIQEKYGLKYDYIEALKIVRDQLLGSYVILCWTANSEYVNLVFEIMNAKGLELASIDLIKNKLFSKLDDEVPIDFASEEWKRIGNNLLQRDSRVPFATFFRHYWNSRYDKVSDKLLYDTFKKKINTKEKCKQLLLDMDTSSLDYVKIVCPMLSDYSNKNQYLNLIETLNNINKVLCVNIPRVLILNLYQKYKSGIITTKKYEETLKFIERFHFIYNGVCTERANRLDSIYCTSAKKLYEATNKEECEKVINEFKSTIITNLPSKENYMNQIKKLKYNSKVNCQSNVLCRYFCQEVEKQFSNKKYNEQSYSIEHILGENIDDDETLFISRLMLMHRDDNSRIPDCSLLEKHKYYKCSTYSYPKYISEKIKDCTSVEELIKTIDEEFEKRAEEYYKMVSGK